MEKVVILEPSDWQLIVDNLVMEIAKLEDSAQNYKTTNKGLYLSTIQQIRKLESLVEDLLKQLDSTVKCRNVKIESDTLPGTTNG